MFFLRKSKKLAARGYSKIVTYEHFNIYYFVIPLFHYSFYGELISGTHFFLSVKASSCFVCKNQKWPPDTILKL